jgi:universal stress protein A
MAKRILVPLDGRDSSDQVIPAVTALASWSGGSVRLLRVAPVPERIVGPYNRVIAYADQEQERLTQEAMAEFRRVEAQLSGVPVESVVRFGDAVEEIALEAAAFDADLIVLTESRRGRLGEALAPSVAHRVGGKTSVPTLVLRQ